MRLTSALPSLHPSVLTRPTLLPAVFSPLTVAWNSSVPRATADVSEVPAEPTGLSVGTVQRSLAVPVDWDDLNGLADYPVNRPLCGPRQDLNNGASGTAGTNYFLKRLPLALHEGVVLKGTELSEAHWSQEQ